MTIAATRYAAWYVGSTPDAEMERRAELLQERMDNDLIFAAAERARRERIENDPFLPDWLKEIYLDRTILDNPQLQAFFGDLSIQKIWDLSAPLKHKRRPRPHPRMTPESDVILKVVGGRPSPGHQLGKAAEWWVGAHRGLIQAVQETLAPNESPQRHGRARGAEVIEEHWFTEHAGRIAKVQQLLPGWVDEPLSTTILALMQLRDDHEELDIEDRTVAGQVSRCLRVLRSQELENRKKKAARKR